MANACCVLCAVDNAHKMFLTESLNLGVAQTQSCGTTFVMEESTRGRHMRSSTNSLINKVTLQYLKKHACMYA